MTTPHARTHVVDGGRTYQVTHDGTPFTLPSVNTLKGLLAAPALEGWKINRHVEEAYLAAAQAASLDSMQFRKYVRSIVSSDTAAMDRGNRCHEIAEAVILDVEPPDYTETEWVAAAVAAFVERFEVEPLTLPDGRPSTELTVVHVDLDGIPRWAGTSDGFVSAVLEDGWRQTIVVDWKTGSVYPDAILTTSGYICATHWVDEHGVTQPLPFHAESGVIVQLSPASWTVHPIYLTDAWACAHAMRHLAEVWQYRQLYEPPVRPGL